MLSLFEILQTVPKAGKPVIGSETEPLGLTLRAGDILLLKGYSAPRHVTGDSSGESVFEYRDRLRHKSAVVVSLGAETAVASTLHVQGEFLFVNLLANLEENGIEQVLRPTVSGETATLCVILKSY
jgi:hypothetical protein